MSSNEEQQQQQQEQQKVPKLFSLEWFSNCVNAYNADPRTLKFKETTDAIYEVKNAPDGPIYLLCKEGRISCRPYSKGDKTEFHIEGDYAKWLRWHKGDYGLVSAVTLKIFKSKGPLWRLLRMGPWLLIWDEYGKKIPGLEWSS